MKKFKIDYSFILTLIIAILSPYQIEFILIILALFIHELGHLFFTLIFKIKINSIRLSALGFFMDIDNQNISFIKELLIYAGGIIFNLITILLFDFLDKYSYFILMINILPIYPLDGFRLLKALISYLFFYRIALYISHILSIIFLIFLYFYIIKDMDHLLFINIIYLIILNIMELYLINKSYHSFLLNRYLYGNNYRKRRIGFKLHNENYLYKYHKIYINLGNKAILQEDILSLKYNYL
ncbi:MAG: hypothetical protein IJY14_02225 [Acholeplasmatales bacterium]|nr:hypothetical protein [Acholeplasmatales bacterium]